MRSGRRGAAGRQPTRLIAALVVTASTVACMPTGPEARRDAYLECARSQGVPVMGGTIRTTSAEELAKLDACEALPR